MSCCHPGRSDACQTPSAPPPSGASRPPSAIVLSGGRFWMGSDEGYLDDDEGPVRQVTVAPLALDAYAVSNQRFALFIAATGYQTTAERAGWSHVFAGLLPPGQADDYPAPTSLPWWRAVPGANWRHPEGPDSELTGRANHPVVHLSFYDASAYCTWAGGRLPRETEWEYAARGGRSRARYPWGDELTPGGQHRCNIWQGEFPVHNTAEDGYLGTAPVDAYLPNDWGFYNSVGNVWEWCADLWHQAQVIQGGSYLCHRSYCERYRVAARTATEPAGSSGNTGVRCAWDIEPPAAADMAG